MLVQNYAIISLICHNKRMLLENVSVQNQTFNSEEMHVKMKHDKERLVEIKSSKIIYKWIYPKSIWHIEADTKWPPFRKRRFHMRFLEWKCRNFAQDFTAICSCGMN